MEEKLTPQMEEENPVIENEEISDDSQEIYSEDDNENNEYKTRIYGIIGLIAFFILGGIGYCPWYIWPVVVFLGYQIYKGGNKKAQLISAALVIVLGTPIIFGSDSEESAGVSKSESYSNSGSYSNSDNSLAGPSWIEGRWVLKGYVPELGGYQDVAIDIKRSSRQFVMVDKNLGKDVGTYKVYGNTLSTSNGTSFELDNYNHRIGLGGGLYLTKK